MDSDHKKQFPKFGSSVGQFNNNTYPLSDRHISLVGSENICDNMPIEDARTAPHYEIEGSLNDTDLCAIYLERDTS